MESRSKLLWQVGWSGEGGGDLVLVALEVEEAAEREEE